MSNAESYKYPIYKDLHQSAPPVTPDSFDHVQIAMGGSGGIDNIQYMSEPVSLIVPLPPAAWAGLLMLGGLGIYRKVRRPRETAGH